MANFSLKNINWGQLKSNLTSNLKDYSKSAFSNLVNQVKAQMTGELGTYYVSGEKPISILESNFPYIRYSQYAVKGNDDNIKGVNTQPFSFYTYDSVNDRYVKSGNDSIYDDSERILLVDPSTDNGSDYSRDTDTIILANRKKEDIVDDEYKYPGSIILSGLTEQEYYSKLASGDSAVQYGQYNEAEDGKTFDSDEFNDTNSNNRESYFGSSQYSNYYGNKMPDDEKDYSLLAKTNNWFAGNEYKERKNITNRNTSKAFAELERESIAKKFNTVISRFHTPKQEKNDIGNTAKSNTYGLSRGRNLLKEDINNTTNGYSDPYCRVWTWHHQYSKYVTDTIRPFVNSGGTSIDMSDLYSKHYWGNFRSDNDTNGTFGNGASRLAKYGSMFDNNGKTIGLVNITPVWTPHSSYDDKDNVSLQHCMFSIENLAWKGIFSEYDNSYSSSLSEQGLSREQKGPLGGRIMWFPPYDLSFNENSNARWEENNFIGRGEPIYTYSNTNRSGSLSFKLLIDHPAVLDFWDRRNEGEDSDGGVDDISSKEQTLLRFFAGCSVLSCATEQTVDNSEDSNESRLEPEDDEIRIAVPVFFPNNYSGTDDIKDDNPVNPIEYLLNGVGAQVGALQNNTNNIQDIPTTMANRFSLSRTNTDFGGYEMMNGKGISIIRKAIVDDKKSDEKNLYLGYGSYNENNYYLYKKYDPKEYGWCYNNNKQKKIIKIKGIKEWAYRIDEDYIHQVFKENIDSYVDNKSYQLNSKGLYDFNILSELGLDNESGNTYSLMDLYASLNTKCCTTFSDYITNDKKNTLIDLMNGKLGTITRINCVGNASKVGYNRLNVILANNRAKTLQTWLSKEFKNKGIKVNAVDISDDTITSESEYKKSNIKVDNNQANGKAEKLARRAIAYIYYKKTATTNASETNESKDENGNSENTAVINNSENPKSKNNSKSNETTNSASNKTTTNKIVKYPRYDNEARFFQKLGEKDPFIIKKISERIKYFNPAFHSMSPEGFNARLTFLNQCMRQGPTISGVDTNGSNPNNLAFGRAPVCVLRIGDFYNTKIVITSLNITYDPLVWDLNHEGIGVMPMIANVSLSFNFIGGSELGGPIQRLQNALSFNYYANTSVYDNRAEEIEYGDLGKVTAFKPYGMNSTINEEDTTQEQ